MKYFIDRFVKLLENEDINKLAEYLGLKDSSYIYHWRIGYKYPRLNNLIKIANFFECPLDYLLGRDDAFYEINITPNVKFVDQLEKVMKEKGFKQKQLVNDKIISRTNIYDWRHDGNSPSMDIVIKLADYLNVSVDHLVGRE